MTFGIRISNDKGRVVFGDDDPPYRFLTADEPMDLEMWGTRRRWRKDITDRYSPSSMFYIDFPGFYTDPWFYGEPIPGGYYNVVRDGGRVYVYAINSSGRDYWPNISEPPRLFMIGRVRPSSNATGYGININDSQGGPLINSSTPIVNIDDIVQATTVASGSTIIGPSDGKICIVENVTGLGFNYRFVYPDGGTSNIWEWSSFSILKGSGVFEISASFITQEAGENEVYLPWIVPVRCMLIKRPSKPYGW